MLQFVLRHISTVGLVSLLSLRAVEAQQAPTVAGTPARDSTTLVGRGAWDGARAAAERSGAGAFRLGLASGVFAWAGLAIALPIANRNVEVSDDHLRLMTDTSTAYR